MQAVFWLRGENIHKKTEKCLTIPVECDSIFKQSVTAASTPQKLSVCIFKNTRGWRNWQTRTFEVRVVYPWGFESPPSHHEKSTMFRFKSRYTVVFYLLHMQNCVAFQPIMSDFVSMLVCRKSVETYFSPYPLIRALYSFERRP